jgi:hypothetical protein
MLKFSEFITEGGYGVPVVSLSKDKVDLAKENTRNEINRNIAAELSRTWMNPYGGWMKIRKVLSMYNIFLPNVIFQDEEEGEEVIAIQQFGDKFGADLSGVVTSPHEPDDAEFYLYYSYGIGDSGFYEAFAVVTDEDGLNDLMSDDTEIDDEEGDLDPRQP